jgi:adenine-specific DNA-methyltransferase
MSSKQIRADVLAALNTLAIGDLQQSTTALLNTLGYASNKTLDLPNKPEVFVKQLEALLGSTKQLHADNASLPDWKSAAFLFQLTNDELPALAAGQLSLLAGSGGVQAHQIESFVFIAIDLKPGTWSRTRLALLTREVNRLFPMPAVLLFRHPQEDGAPLLSVAVIHRRTNKRDASRDVIEGKVSIIKDIDLAQPHAAHLRILESMALTEVDAKYVPSNFDKLYEAWLKVLDVKELNNRFYDELARWYYWAIAKETGVVFPQGQPLESSDDPFTKNRPTVAMIRLLTRLIFVWFLKEKRLVPAQLFDEKALSNLLSDAPHLHASQGNYYKAILQNLFFATLNTEMTDEDEDGNKQRVWREAAGPKRMDKYLIHTVYRYQSAFKDADAALALFRQVPFLNGGLFECLDKLITPEDIERDPSLKDRVVTEGKQTVLRADGFSERPENPMHIPNELFFGEGTAEVDLNDVFGTKNKKYKPKGLLKIFDSYKFTIEENTPVEEEVALDPELLGKVFENLLASYNPDTKTTARKKSGSFYTPREVVDYMVDEALVFYLNKPLAQSNIAQAATKYAANGLLDLGAGPGDLAFIQPTESQVGAQLEPTEVAPTNPLAARLRRLLSYRHTSHDFSSAEAHTLIAAIEQLRVLDPACGSGAFPMGMLQKLVAVLRKLDPDNTLWKAQNRAPLLEQLASAKKLRDPTLRDEQITTAQAALDKFDADFADPAYADYARKLYLIEKCLYGVDIQPIAVQIAKLRFFISLVVEQKLGTAQQRTKGQITPLPNLETKIVAANTLLPIPRDENKTNYQFDIVNNLSEVKDKEADLREANASHFAAKRFRDKRKRKERILKLRDELVTLLKAELLLKPELANRIAAWDPFDQNQYAQFFDPELMFGFDRGFDVVIGNPPYVRQEAIKEFKLEFKEAKYATYNGTADLYVYFYERAFQLLQPGGVLSFITSNKWFRAKYGADLRQYMATHTQLEQIIDFGDEAVFDALAYPTIVIATKRSQAIAADTATNAVWALNWDSKNEAHQVSDFPDVFATERFAVPQNELKPGGWQLEPPTKRRLLERLRKAGQPLGDYCEGRFYYGIKTGLNEAFVISRAQRDALVAQDPQSADIIKPFLRGRDVKRWNVEFEEQYLIKIESSENTEHPWSKLPADKAEKVFGKKYPAIYGWFTAEDHRQQLIDRTDQGRYFWELRSCAYWDDFAAPKIIYPDIYLHQSLAWDESGQYCGNTAYFIPNAEKWLTAVLNSAVHEWFYDQISTRMQGGYLRAFTDKMKALPVPNSTDTQRQVIENCIDAVRISISRPEYERLLNGLVYELFFPEDLYVKNIRLFDACKAAGIGQWPQAEALAADAPQGKNEVAALAFAVTASSTAEQIFHPSHAIYGQLFELQTLEVVRLIEGEA